MIDSKTDQYWLTAAADIRRFCKGEMMRVSAHRYYGVFAVIFLIEIKNE